MKCALLAVAIGLGAGEEKNSYPLPDLLVEPKAGVEKNYHFLDARSASKYAAGHIPGAVWIDQEAWSKRFSETPFPLTKPGFVAEAFIWSAKIGVLGIDNSTKVVVYDDALAKDAARIWYILRYIGVKDVRLLNGGYPAWTAAGLTVGKDRVVPAEKIFTVGEAETARFADKARVLAIVEGKTAQIIDARSLDEHCGDDKLKNKRGGAIPGAIHLEWSDALDKKTQKFKTAPELSKILKDAGIDLAKPSVTHCQSGGRAAVMAFTLELMGAKEVANYYRGWSEWGNDEKTPIVTPKKK
ncbi:MAG: sulfurtransferase [Gemmataceae bacterium]|nr:sulfurtransferase [Gemmataceae bacterium]